MRAVLNMYAQVGPHVDENKYGKFYCKRTAAIIDETLPEVFVPLTWETSDGQYGVICTRSVIDRSLEAASCLTYSGLSLSSPWPTNPRPLQQ